MIRKEKNMCSEWLPRMLSNLVNGNLTLAREQADRFWAYEIYEWLVGDDVGWNTELAVAAALYLKDGSFELHQRYADADLDSNP